MCILENNHHNLSQVTTDFADTCNFKMIDLSIIVVLFLSKYTHCLTVVDAIVINSGSLRKILRYLKCFRLPHASSRMFIRIFGFWKFGRLVSLSITCIIEKLFRCNCIRRSVLVSDFTEKYTSILHQVLLEENSIYLFFNTE